MGFSSKIKYRGVLVLPTLALLLVLLIPQIHWVIAILIAMFFLAIGFWYKKKLIIKEDVLAFEYPFRFSSRGYSIKLDEITRIVYVDLTDSVSKSEPNSHVNIYLIDKRPFKKVDIMLTNKEVSELDYILNSYDIDFEYTTKVEVHEV